MLQRYTSFQPTKDSPQVQAILERTVPPESGQRSWYSIRNLSEAEAEIMIYDYIGYGGVSADGFVQELASLSAPKLTLRVNSPGGDVFDGFAIFNAIRRHKSEVTAYVDGIAASAASFLIMAADEVVMSPHAQLMIHDAYALCMGSAADMERAAEMLNKASDNIARVYAERAGGGTKEWRERMKSETWITDREAVELGLADRIDGVAPEEDDEIAATADGLPKNEEPPEEPPPPPSVDWNQLTQEFLAEDEAALFAPKEEVTA